MAAMLVGIAAPVATAAVMVQPSAEAHLEERLHAERDAAGLHRYERVPELDEVARGWAVDLASRQTLEHRSNLAEVMGDYEKAGEVVGRGSTTDGVHDGWMASPPHRRELMHTEMTQAGYGAAYGDDGLIYLVEVFRKPASTPPPDPEPEPAVTPTTAPPEAAVSAASASAEPPPTTTVASAEAVPATTSVPAPPNLDRMVSDSAVDPVSDSVPVQSASIGAAAVVATPALSSRSTPFVWILVGAWTWCSVAGAWLRTSRRLADGAGRPR